MTSIYLKVGFVAGTTIEEAIQEMVDLARRIDVNADAMFNDVPLFATPRTSVDELMRQWKLWLLFSSRSQEGPSHD